MAAVGSTGDKKKEDLHCEACFEELSSVHLGIRCLQNHHLCTDCSQTFVGTVLSGGVTYIPVKCQRCKTEVTSASFERQLTEPQRKEYLSLVVVAAAMAAGVDLDQIVLNCARCKYAEVREARPEDVLFVHCQKEGCQATTCFYCAELMPDVEDGGSYASQEQADEVLVKHLACAEWGIMRAQANRAIERGSLNRCPGCGLAGQKDDNCTHMTCVKCQCQWCYVCGRDVSAIGFYPHNANWSEDEQKCPMYFTEVSDVDDTWPEDDSAALQLFHYVRTIAALRILRDHIGRDKMTRLIALYPGTFAGFNLQHIMTGRADGAASKEPCELASSRFSSKIMRQFVVD